MTTLPSTLFFLESPVDAFTLKSELFDHIHSQLHQFSNCIHIRSKADFLEQLPSAETVVCWSFKKEWYANAPLLNDIYTPAAGHDWIEPDPEQHVQVHHGKFHGELMRESLLSMMLFFNQRIDILQQAKQWNKRTILSNTDRLCRQTVMIIGFGNIGRSCASLLKAFGANIIGVKRSGRNPKTDDDADLIIRADQLTKHLPKTDHIVLILPGGRGTDKTFSKACFTSLKHGACLFNIGRGNCYSEENLIHALKSGQLAGAGLDVFATEPLPETSELWSLPNVLISPHASAVCKYYLPTFADEFIANLKNPS